MSDEQTMVGQTRDVGFQVGARRTLPIPLGAAWDMLLGPRGLAVWLGELASAELAQGQPYALADGRGGVVRVLREGSHLRLTLGRAGDARASTVQLRLLPQGQRTTVAFHEEHLPGPAEREQRRQFYHAALDALAALCGDA